MTVVVVGIGNHLAFLRHVRRLLSEHVAERVVGERRLSACWVVDLRAAVAHVVNGCCHVALGVRHPHETLDAVVLKCGGNRTVGSARLDCLDSLTTTIGMGNLMVLKSVLYIGHKIIASQRIRSLGNRTVRQSD